MMVTNTRGGGVVVKPDMRDNIVRVAHVILNHKAECHYSMDANRWNWHHNISPAFPLFTDCSGSFTAIVYWGGGNDPNGLNFGWGNTKTLLSHARNSNLITTKSKILPADGCLFGMEPDGVTPKHVAMFLQPGTVKDPMMFNMGGSLDPSVDSLSTLLSIGSPIFFHVITRHR